MTKPSTPASLQVGNDAPGFLLPTDGGKSVSLDMLKGRHVILYFYPKDDTPGCTTEAISFSELLHAFRNAGADVVGISRDTLIKHDKFKNKHGLKIILGSDEDGSTCDAYGVWVEKRLYGRTYMGIERATFLIDPAGKIRKIWRKVKVPGHAADVLSALRDG